MDVHRPTDIAWQLASGERHSEFRFGSEQVSHVEDTVQRQIGSNQGPIGKPRVSDDVQRHVGHRKAGSFRLRADSSDRGLPGQRVTGEPRKQVRMDFDGAMTVVAKECRFLVIVVIDGVGVHFVGADHSVAEIEDRVVGRNGMCRVDDQKVDVRHPSSCRVRPDFFSLEKGGTLQCNRRKSVAV